MALRTVHAIAICKLYMDNSFKGRDSKHKGFEGTSTTTVLDLQLYPVARFPRSQRNRFHGAFTVGVRCRRMQARQRFRGGMTMHKLCKTREKNRIAVILVLNVSFRL